MSHVGLLRPTVLLIVGVAVAFVLAACGTAEQPRNRDRDLFVPSTDSEDGLSLVIADLLCQIDRQSLTAMVVGRVENRTDMTLVDITPNVRWLNHSDTPVSTVIGDSVDELTVGESTLFSISTFLSEGMEVCRVDVGGRGNLALTGEIQAEAILTSELAR